MLVAIEVQFERLVDLVSVQVSRVSSYRFGQVSNADREL
jgi:hypothetical protein